MKPVLIALLVLIAFDILLYYTIPLPGVVLDLEHECDVDYAFMATGCAKLGETPAYTKFPSFLTASHEYLHTQGYGEKEAYTATFALFGAMFGWMLFIIEVMSR